MTSIINFYKGTELKYSVYSNSLEDVKKDPRSYYPEYTEDMYITDHFFQHPIIKNNELIEMTREEKIERGLETNLENGEYLKNKKLIKVQQPSEYHFWNKETNKWETALIKSQTTKRLSMIFSWRKVWNAAFSFTERKSNLSASDRLPLRSPSVRFETGNVLS